MNERAYTVQGLSASSAAELEAMRKQAAAVDRAEDPTEEGTVQASADVTAKSSLRKLLDAVETHNGANYGPELPKQASANMASIIAMAKAAADEAGGKKRKSKEVNLAPRHFVPTPAFAQPSILGESVGLTPEQQVKANWNAYYNALGYGLGALAGAVGGGVLGGSDNVGAVGLGAVGGGLLGHYLTHKIIQSQRDLGNEADFDWKYFLPFTGAHEAVQLAGANKAQQEQAYNNAYKATLGAMGGNIASNLVGLPIAVATGNPAVGQGVGRAVSWAVNPLAERAAVNNMAD